jgi:hypothetical protein
MNRRELLRRTGTLGTLGVLGLAGCTSDVDDAQSGTDGGDGGGSGPDDPSATATPTGTPDPVTVTDRSVETTASGCLSDDDRSTHSARYDRQAKTVTIVGALVTPTPCHEATVERIEYDIDSGTLAVVVGSERTDGTCIECIGLVEYEATIDFSGGVPDSVDVTHEEPSVDGRGSETPSLVDSSLSVTDVSSSLTDTTAEVSFDGGENTVGVTGTIEGTDTCQTASLRRVTHNASDGSLRVDIETTDREGANGCTQAIVYVDYEATVQFDGGIPTTVSVSHNGTSVTTGAYSSASASPPDDQS